MIQLTQQAADHVQQMLQQRGYGIGLRMGLHKTGCSGYAYEVSFADQVDSNDVVFESHDVKIVIDKSILSNLDGTEIDYLTSNPTHHGFSFNNPHAHDVCGCGESFSI